MTISLSTKREALQSGRLYKAGGSRKREALQSGGVWPATPDLPEIGADLCGFSHPPGKPYLQRHGCMGANPAVGQTLP